MLPQRRAFVFGATALLTAWFVSPQPLEAAEHIIEIQDFAFAPVELVVAPGDKVTWINRDIAPHTATADDETWDTQELKTGEAKSIVVTSDMKLEYFCRFHPHLKAKLILKSDTAQSN